MKKFLKFILIFVLVIVLLVGATVATVFIVLSDKTNEVDVASYEELSTQEVISAPLNDALSSMKDTYKFDFALNEKQINNLIYSIIKAKLNPNYNPKTGTTDEELNVYTGVTVPAGVPVFEGKTVAIKSIYVKLNDDLLTLNATVDAAGALKSRVYVTLKIETTSTTYKMTIIEGKVGKLNLFGSLGKKAMDGADLASSINSTLQKNEIPFKFDSETLELVGTKEEVNVWLAKLAKGKEENALKDMFIDTFLDPEKDLIAIATGNNLLGVNVNLAGLKVDDSLTKLDSEISKDFDKDLFVNGKSQQYIVNCMTGNHTISFTELEINKLIYSNTNGYEGLGQETNLMEGVSFKFGVDGVIFDINDDKATTQIRLILNINGLLTTVLINGENKEVDGDLEIDLFDKVILGNDFRFDSSVIFGMLDGAFGTSSIIKYNKANNAMLIEKEFMTEMLASAGANGGAKLEVERLVFVPNGLKAYISYTDTELEATVADVVSHAEEVLATDFIDEGQFDTTEEGQQEAVETLVEELGNISEILSNPEQELTEEDTEALIDAINNLSEENQQAFYDQVASEIGEEELRRLYEQMFGGGN